MTVLITNSIDGYPVLQNTNCEVDLHVSIDVHGSGRFANNVFYCEILSIKCSWLYNQFESKLGHEIKHTLRSKVCENVRDTTTEWNSALAAYPCKNIAS